MVIPAVDRRGYAGVLGRNSKGKRGKVPWERPALSDYFC